MTKPQNSMKAMTAVNYEVGHGHEAISGPLPLLHTKCGLFVLAYAVCRHSTATNFWKTTLTSTPKLGWRKHDSFWHRGCLTFTISSNLSKTRGEWAKKNDEEGAVMDPQVE